MSADEEPSNLTRLNAFVGKWRTEGEFRPESGASGTFTATDEYEWLEGRFFLIHRWHARMPDGPSSGIEILGHDPATGTFPAYSFDNQGNVSTMLVRCHGASWTFEGQTLRFMGSFVENGDLLAGTWERREGLDKEWVPWLEVRLRRVAS